MLWKKHFIIAVSVGAFLLWDVVTDSLDAIEVVDDEVKNDSIPSGAIPNARMKWKV